MNSDNTNDDFGGDGEDDFANAKFKEALQPDQEERGDATKFFWRANGDTLNCVEGTLERARELSGYKNVLRSPAQLRNCISVGQVYGVSSEPFDGKAADALLFVSDEKYPRRDSVERHKVPRGTVFCEFIGPSNEDGLGVDYVCRLIQLGIIGASIRGANLGLATDKAACWVGDLETEIVLKALGQKMVFPQEEWPRSGTPKVRALRHYFDNVAELSDDPTKNTGLVLWNRDTVFEDARVIRDMLNEAQPMSDGHMAKVILPGGKRSLSLELIEDIIARKPYVLESLYGTRDLGRAAHQ